MKEKKESFVGEFVKVEWNDIATHPGWWENDIMEAQPMRCLSLGRCLHFSETRLIIASSEAADFDSATDVSQYGDLIVIPSGCVIKLTPLK